MNIAADNEPHTDLTISEALTMRQRFFHGFLPQCVGLSRRVLYILSVFEYLEVALELFAQRKGSEPLKWLIILLIVVTK